MIKVMVIDVVVVVVAIIIIMLCGVRFHENLELVAWFVFVQP